MPFPGGIVRSGSKVGGKYKGMMASTNDAFAPTLRGVVNSALDAGHQCGAGDRHRWRDQRCCDGGHAGRHLKAVIELGPERGCGAHQRRQLWRQARQVPLSPEGSAAMKALTFTLLAEPEERLDLSALDTGRAGRVDGCADRQAADRNYSRSRLGGRYVQGHRQRCAEHRFRGRQRAFRQGRHRA